MNFAAVLASQPRIESDFADPVSLRVIPTSERWDMAETYLEITQQIEALRQKAESIRAAEIEGVITRIKTAIEAYGLTADQLFEAARAPQPTPGRKPAGTGRDGGTRFRDDSGNSWSGRGPRPGWIKAALAAGKSIEEFSVGSNGVASSNGGARRRTRAGPVVAPKYKDGDGHSWSGRGPRPAWVKAALAAGKTLDELT